MPLIKVKRVDYEDKSYAYAPPIVDAVLNTDKLVSASPVQPDRRIGGNYLRVFLTDGEVWTIEATVEDLLSKMENVKTND